MTMNPYLRGILFFFSIIVVTMVLFGCGNYDRHYPGFEATAQAACSSLGGMGWYKSVPYDLTNQKFHLYVQCISGARVDIDVVRGDGKDGLS
jgi:hypothetical protein